jgi:hypothetical protein
MHSVTGAAFNAGEAGGSIEWMSLGTVSD